MISSPLLHTDSEGTSLHAILSLSALRSLDQAGITALESIGVRSVGDLLHWDAVHHARTLMALSRGVIAHEASVDRVLDASAAHTPWGELPAAPVVAVKTVGPPTAAVLGSAFGVRTVADLASFAPFVEAEAFLTPDDYAFREPSSAPVDLLPKPTGAVVSSIRYSSFVREVDLRQVKLTLPPNVLQNVPVADVFTGSVPPVVYLGYAAGHLQKWINAGTHLGEVIHSLPLAPGESRNIAIVDWKRRQIASRDENTTIREQVDSTQVHKRALDEVARAVAEEHQYGKTSTEANTAATSGSFVAAGSVVGGVAGGVVGAVGGGVTGLAIDALVLGGDGGAGTIFGTIAGGAVGSVVGGAAGAAAGGLIYSGATAMGLIESSSEGDRDIIANTQQNITQSTVQKSSAIRSLWSTIVVEDVESESSEIRTTNVTNYNHMHALTVQYYEVLQHYRTQLSLASVKPLLFLPFQPLRFTFTQIRSLWPYLEETARQALPPEALEAAFASLPPEPQSELPELAGTQPFDPVATKVKKLAVRTKTDLGFNGLSVSIKKKDGTFTDVPRVNNHPENSLNVGDDGADRLDHFELSPDVLAKDIVGIRVHKSTGTGANVRVYVQYTIDDGTATTYVHTSWKNLGKQSFENSFGEITRDYAWNLHAELVSAQEVAEEGQSAYENALAAHAQALADHQALIDTRQEARDQLEELFRWRRYQFTRAILEQVEPYQLAEVFEALVIETDQGSTPLHRIAHTVPLGTTGSSFVFELKRNPFGHVDELDAYADLASGMTGKEIADQPLGRILRYAHELLGSFERAPRRFEVTENVYLPTSGVFAEAVLGRSNAAEKLDLTRFYNWQDSPIPNAAPEILAADPNADRNDNQTLEVTTPGSTINLVNPVAFPDTVGLAGVIGAVQNGSIFRDMSKSSELAGVIGNLSSLAAEMGKASSEMTGEAASQAFQSATEVAKTAANLAQSLMKELDTPSAPAPGNPTEKGATMAQLERMMREARARGTNGNGTSADSNGHQSVTPELSPGDVQGAQLDALGVGDPPPLPGTEGGVTPPEVPPSEPDVLVDGQDELQRPLPFGPLPDAVRTPVLGLLSIYFSQYEGDDRIPPQADRLFRFNAVQGLGQILRHDHVHGVLDGGAPETLGSLMQRALLLAGGDPAVASLLCHNHCRSMGKRPGTLTFEEMALGWDRREGTANPVQYEARVFDDASLATSHTRRYSFPGESAFYVLFDGAELGTDDPNDWYHFYLTHSISAYFSSGRMIDETGFDLSGDGYTVESLGLYWSLKWIIGLLRDANPGADPDDVHHEGWLWANAMSFLEGMFYAEPESQDDSSRESRVHRAGALAGIDRTFGITNLAPGSRPNWRWHVPKAMGLWVQVRQLLQSLDTGALVTLTEDLAGLADSITPFVHEVLDVDGDPVPPAELGVVASPSSAVLALNQRVPNTVETAASGPIAAPVQRDTPEFSALIENTNPSIVFKDEELTGADRHMTAELSAHLDSLASLVAAEWPGARLRVTEAWDEDGEHTTGSLHYEGRAADLTVWMSSANPTDTAKLGRLAQLAVDAGFDWVWYEDAAHVHASVKANGG